MPPHHSRLATNPYDYLDVRRPILDSTCFEPLEIADKLGADYRVARPAQPYISILPLLTETQIRTLRTPIATSELARQIQEQPRTFSAERTILSSSLTMPEKGFKTTANGVLFFAENTDLESESTALAASIRAHEGFLSVPRAQILIARVAFKSMQNNTRAVTKVRDIIQSQLEELNTPLTVGPAEVYVPSVSMPPTRDY